MPHDNRRSVFRHILFAACAALAAAPAAQAQNYPTKPIRLILAFAGGSDTVGRLVAGKMSEALGQQIVPEPRVGATGNIGFLAAAKAPADGYTIVMGAVPILTNPHLNPEVGYDFRDFAPISLLATIPNAIVVHPSVPARNMKELISLARANPGKIAYGSGGFGSANHLASELLQLTAKIKFTHVPYKSATLRLGRIDRRRRGHGDRGRLKHPAPSSRRTGCVRWWFSTASATHRFPASRLRPKPVCPD